MTSLQFPDSATERENALPRVPLPTLEASCARFLEWCAPLLTADELAETAAAVDAFLAPGSDAYRLHEALVEYDSTPGVASWLDAFWRYRYLGRRDRIALNANFFFLFHDDVDTSGESQPDRAASLVRGALDYKRAIDEDRLPPPTQRGRPLSAIQDRYLFSGTRIPGEVLDSSRTPYTAEWPGPSTERHVVVFHRGVMYRVDVLDEAGRPYAAADLAATFAAITEAAVNADPNSSIGHLTTKARAEWAASRQALLALDPANARALDTVERALFCLALEPGRPDGPLAAGNQLLWGDSANRWFDKALTLIVFADGTAGLNSEHCHLDGTTVIGLVDSLLDPAKAASVRQPHEPAKGTPTVERVDVVLDDALRADVRAAGEAFAAYGAATATTLLALDDFGADDIKALGLSPDGFAQMAFQLAHQRAKGHVGATYESISTRQFRGGRTEAMRVVTPESARFARLMDAPDASAQERLAAFRAAVGAHVARSRECAAGDAPEQHLWELQLIAARRGAATPLALYDSPGWRILRDDYLSTSAVPSVNVQYWGFGSTSPTCIGVAYALLPGQLHIYLSTPRAVEAPMHVFASQVRAAVRELVALCAAGE